ncbi:hypothetical protein HMPREF9080_00959 [Cardiobacterium valvarum F0432]|uniref:Uncharacterized protein n=1 Tax=Cardiobacterium valvarum F0432 TaxID=797473 RepID=G9ZDX5_9GAMM|nr:hypothetical protein HMPREF9080_00959 [Cardiobacterium valvarum F0432]
MQVKDSGQSLKSLPDACIFFAMNPLLFLSVFRRLSCPSNLLAL